MKPTGIVRDESYLKHDMGQYHPECPDRLAVIYGMIDQIGPDLNVTEISARDATLEEIATVHHPSYVEKIVSTAGRDETYLDADTSTCAHSWTAASRAVGGVFNLIDAVMAGRVRNGFALVRPPGHHAENRRAMGFCLFNNIALAAEYALLKHKLERIAVVDWDLHHGNGTQNAFYEDHRVLFMSTHQYPHYPGTGAAGEIGAGVGRGYTVNFPMPGGCGDGEYMTVFHMVVAPILEAFRPQLILLSAGFDAHKRDPLGAMNVTEDGYEQMLQVLMHLAAELCSDRLVLTLEGGYHLQALAASVERALSCLCTYDPEKEGVPLQPPMDGFSTQFRRRLMDVLSLQRTYWPTVPIF